MQTSAAEYASMMTGKSDHTIRKWKVDFLETGEIPESRQGHYLRSGVLWYSEEVNEKATKYVRDNANVKGAANLKQHKHMKNINKAAQMGVA